LKIAWNPKGVACRADSVAQQVSGQKTLSPHATTDVRYLPSVLPASASALASSVFLKNETCDPSHLCISATMGLVMPVRLKGGKGHP
jgi:hypothetical protein